MVVGITQMDNQRTPTIEEYVAQLKELNLSAPVYEIDGRKREDVSTLVQSLLLSLDPGI
jgi:signal recognition particle receptor subunit beta